MNQNILRRNNVKISGDGAKTLMFAHGFGCDQNMWRFVTPEFADDYKIVLFDYVGSGKSDLSQYKPERYGDLQGYVQRRFGNLRRARFERRDFRRAFGQQYDRRAGFDRATRTF